MPEIRMHNVISFFLWRWHLEAANRDLIDEHEAPITKLERAFDRIKVVNLDRNKLRHDIGPRHAHKEGDFVRLDVDLDVFSRLLKKATRRC